MRYSEHGHATTQNQSTLEQFKRKFSESTKHGQELLTLLSKSDVGVWKCEQDQGPEGQRREWWIYITLPKNLQEMFDLHLEIPVLYTEFPRIEPRILERIQRRIVRDARLETGVAILASIDPEVARLARRRRGEISLIDLNLAELSTDHRDVRSRISTVLTAVDHFDLTNPIQSPSGFFGRRAEIDQLTHALNRGQSVGIFGLRKAGKTSLMNSIQRLRSDLGSPVVKLDISEVGTADEFKLRLLERAWTAVQATESVAGEAPVKMPALRLLNSKGEAKSDISNLGLYWTEDLRKLISQSSRRLELFIDEIDQAYPLRDEPDLDTTPLFQALVQLRGLVQSATDTDGGIVLLCAGVDPSIFEEPLIDRRDNLLYKLVQLLWLAPMNSEEMGEMVKDLGRRMAVRFPKGSRSVLDKLYSQFGGHPLLTRRACSDAVKGRTPDELPYYITDERLASALAKRGVGSVAAQAGDIFRSFSEWFPEEAQVLPLVWSSDPEEREFGAELVEELPEGLAHARAYGLMFDDGSPRIHALLPVITGSR